MPERPRFLILGDAGLTATDWLRHCGLEADLVRADSWDAGLLRLDHQPIDAIVANPADPAVLRGLRALVQAQHILAVLPDGVAVVDAEMRVRWANPTFEAWCNGSALGRCFHEALGAAAESVSALLAPLRTALLAPPSAVARTLAARLPCCGERVLEVYITPIS